MTPIAPGSDRRLTIRQLLNSRDLAAARLRIGMARRLGISESEMLAVAFLAQHGRLTPSALGDFLGLSSGGTTALVRRLEEAGHIVRSPHPLDRRSILVQLSASFAASARADFGPFVEALDDVIARLGEDELPVVQRFLEDASACTEEHATRLQRQGDMDQDARIVALDPGLWS